jgi:hypothetical protein
LTPGVNATSLAGEVIAASLDGRGERMTLSMPRAAIFVAAPGRTRAGERYETVNDRDAHAEQAVEIQRSELRIEVVNQKA